MEQGITSNMTSTQPRSAPTKTGRICCLSAVVLVFLGCLLASDTYPSSSPGQYKEYEVKAAFIYNFLKFVDWPEEKMTKGGKQIIIGIIGEDPFGSAADIFKDKMVEDRNLVVKRLEGFGKLKEMPEKDKNERLAALKGCHLLFVCSSEQKLSREIMDIVVKSNVLTVGDTGGFIETGGIINFLMEDNKIRFDINLTASEKAGIKIRSQLLRLARKVVKDESNTTGADNAAKKEGN